MNFVIVDFETTGNQTDDEIIQIGIVTVDDGVIGECFHSLVKPSRPIPQEITKLTGITNEMIVNAPLMEEVIHDLLPFLAGRIFVAHNSEFDLGYLQRALAANGYSTFAGRVLDTIDFLRMLFPSLASLQLSAAAGALGVVHERPHQADSDAMATAEIWLRILARIEVLPLITIQRLSAIFQSEISDRAWFIHECCRLREWNVAPDEAQNSYFRQFALRVQDWGENESASFEEEKEKANLSETFEAFYADMKEKMKHRFSAYEARPAQDQMGAAVFSAFSEQKHLLVEAGTGTGKSLGYLIPALYYGLHEDNKVVVSTHTINLQEQLKHRDIPLLQGAFPAPFRAAVLKGRGHYLCLRKFEHKLNGSDYANPEHDRITAAQMTVWLGETEHGDDEELHFGPKGVPFWHTVASDSDSCLNRSCPWYKKCFYHRAKYEANQAQLIITNHSLLLSDIKADHRLLPSYQHLIIDEAHHFEEVASNHLGIQLHYNSISNSLLWLLRDSRSGQLPQLKIRLQQSEDERAQTYGERIESLLPQIVKAKEAWDELCEQLFLGAMKDSGGGQGDYGPFVLRLKTDSLPAGWPTVALQGENAALLLNDFLRAFESLLGDLKEYGDEFGIQGPLTDLTGSLNELHRYLQDLRFFFALSDENYVYWVEAGQHYKAKSVMMIALPIDVSSLLQEHVFSQKESVVMTSATLSVNQSFQYVCDQLGLAEDLDSGHLKTIQLDSPFNYREQALVLIPRDFPSLKGGIAGEGEFVAALADSLCAVAIQTGGRMLALFTSNRMLKQTYGLLKEKLNAHGIDVLGQGMDSSNRTRLTRAFMESGSAVLLGTSSFWEGVDIPGDALSCLAIVRLPFQPPNHPFIEAKSEYLKRNGKNPFMNYSVPQAVIRFKQGFGRLVRTAADRGIVLIFDTRVVDTRYGKHFIYSLPGPKMELVTSNGMVSRIGEWMGGTAK